MWFPLTAFHGSNVSSRLRPQWALIIKLWIDADDSLCAGLAGNEPMHVHAVKGDAECKYWLHPDRFDIVEEFEYNCTPRLRREVRQIIFQHFDHIVVAWREHFGGDRAE